jgi:hypothetical protein
MFALMVSTLAKHRILQGIIGIALFIILIWQAIASMAFMSLMLTEFVPFDLPEFRWTLGCVVVVLSSYILLFQQVAVARLTFESDNRSSGIRIVCSAQFAMLWIGLCLFAWEFGWTIVEWEVIAVLACVSGAHLMVIGLLSSTEQEYISRRIRRNMPKSRLIRALIVPWLPGGARGFIYLLMHILALNVIVMWGDWPELVDNLTIGVSCYVVSYIGFGSFVGRWGREITPDIRPIHVRILAILMISMSVVAPYLPPLLKIVDYPVGYSLMEISNPFKTLLLIGDTPGAPQIPTVINLLFVVAGTAILINLKAMTHGVLELVNYEPQNSAESSGVIDDATEATEAS